MKMTLRILLVLFFFAQAQAWAQKSTDPMSTFLSAQEKFAHDQEFFGVMKWEKKGGTMHAGNFWIQGDKFKLQLEDRELICDGNYLFEIFYRDRKVKRRHYDPYEAPAVVHAVRMLRLDLESEHVTAAANGEDLAIEVESGSSIAQGNHRIGIDPVTLNITHFVLHENQGAFLEKCEIGQFQSELKFAPETFSVKVEDWKSKGYSYLDMAKGDNPTIMPEEKALRPLE